MAATTVTLPLPLHPHPHNRRILSHYSLANYQLPFGAAPLLFRCSPSIRLERGLDFTREARAWGFSPRGGMVMGDYGDYIDEDDDEDEDEEDEDRSLDLLIKFVENVFRKVSRRARKAVKSVLPVPISTRLVGFAVNGTIILTFLWVLKAFLQNLVFGKIMELMQLPVICTLGSLVFTSILLIRGIWTGISYFQESRDYRADDDESQPWPGSQPAI